jgi:hypothetical protein
MTASLLLALALAVPSAVEADDLRPPDGVYSSPSLIDPYRLALRDVLLGEHPYRKCQMLVIPSFRAEWVVYIVQEEQGRPARLLYRSMRTPLWGNMLRQIKEDGPDPRRYREAEVAALAKIDKSFQTRVVDLDPASVAALSLAWSDMLARTRYPTRPANGADGTSYFAAHWSEDTGPRSGETWSPEKGSLTSDFVAIAERLRDLALAPTSDQPTLKAQAVGLAVALHRRVRALK